MNANHVLPTLGGSVQPAQGHRLARSRRRIDGLPSSAALPALAGPDAAMRRFVGWIARWYRRRIAIRELQSLSDHYLADIGLDRSQLVSTVERTIETGDRPG